MTVLLNLNRKSLYLQMPTLIFFTNMTIKIAVNNYVVQINYTLVNQLYSSSIVRNFFKLWGKGRRFI